MYLLNVDVFLCGAEALRVAQTGKMDPHWSTAPILLRWAKWPQRQIFGIFHILWFSATLVRFANLIPRSASVPYKDTSIIDKYASFWLKTHQNRSKPAQRSIFQVVNGGRRPILEPYFLWFWQDLTLLPILAKYAFRDAAGGSYGPVKDNNRQRWATKSY